MPMGTTIGVGSTKGSGLMFSIPKTSATGDTEVRLCTTGKAGTRGFHFRRVNGKACGVIGIGSNGMLSICNTSTSGNTILRRCSDGNAITRR